MSSVARFHHLSEGGPPLHFAHANGFPLLSYQHFLQELYADYSVFGLQQRALWPDDSGPPKTSGWRDHAADLIAFLDEQATEPVIGMGHSMGGTISMLAASRRPDLFRGLILIDPVWGSPALAMASKLIPRPWFSRQPMIASTLNRRRHWPDRDAAAAYFRSRGTWQVFTEEALAGFFDHALIPATDGGLQLAFSPEWEAHNYCTIASLWPDIRAQRLPTMIIRGTRSYVQTARVWRKSQRLAPQHRYVQIEDAGHLLPQEAPAATMAFVKAQLDKLTSAPTTR